MRPVVRTLIAATLSFSTGCSSWAVSDASTAPAVIASHPKIRVLTTDGTVLAVDNALFRNDSIVGISDGLPIGIPRSEVKQIAVRGSDGDRTAGLVVLGVIGGGILLLSAVIIAVGEAIGG
jgi:hypothetical protein